MGTLNDLKTLVRLLEEFELPVSPILQYAIKEKMALKLNNKSITAGGDNGLIVC